MGLHQRANYRLAPAARWPDFLVDAKKVVAWTRDHARELGADPYRIFVSGSSSGAHLAVTAALTLNAALLQPGFEDADTSVAGAIGLYGYYGPVDVSRPLPSAPRDYVGPDAPPLLIAHGDKDTYVPPDGARELVAELRAVAENPVVYIELPGGQHSFDLLHSIRFESVINGIEAFAEEAARVTARRAAYSSASCKRYASASAAAPRKVTDRCNVRPVTASTPAATRISHTPGRRSLIDPVPLEVPMHRK